MEEPEGYEYGEPGEYVCLLEKAIYGTKQAQRCAQEELSGAFKEMGGQPVASDGGLYIVRNGSKLMLTGVHVDDGLCVGNDAAFIEECLGKLGQRFELTVVKDPEVYVGIQIDRDRNAGTLKMHQEDAVRKLIASLNLQDCRRINTPMEFGLQLPDPSTIKMSKEEKAFPYQQTVGQMIWLLKTRIDCCFAINVMTRYMGNWNTEVITAAKRIVRYLKGKEALGLIHKRSARLEDFGKINELPNKLISFGDSDYAGRMYDSRCTAAWIIQWGGNTIAFQAKSITIGVSTSTCHAEAMAVKFLCQALEWVLGLLGEIQIQGKGAVMVWQDNQSVIKLSDNPVMHSRSKHFRIAMHYIQDLAQRCIIKLDYLESNRMPADVMTKALLEGAFWELLPLAGFSVMQR